MDELISFLPTLCLSTSKSIAMRDLKVFERDIEKA